MQTVASRPPSGPQQLQQLAAHCSCCHSLCQTDTLLPQVFGENWNAFRQYIKDRFFFSHSWVLLSSQFHSPRSQECNAEISQVFLVIWIELTHFYNGYQFLIKSFCVNCQKKNIEWKKDNFVIVIVKQLKKSLQIIQMFSFSICYKALVDLMGLKSWTN